MCVWGSHTRVDIQMRMGCHMGQPIPVWVPICVWAIPHAYGQKYAYGTEHLETFAREVFRVLKAIAILKVLYF